MTDYGHKWWWYLPRHIDIFLNYFCTEMTDYGHKWWFRVTLKMPKNEKNMRGGVTSNDPLSASFIMISSSWYHHHSWWYHHGDIKIFVVHKKTINISNVHNDAKKGVTKLTKVRIHFCVICGDIKIFVVHKKTIIFQMSCFFQIWRPYFGKFCDPFFGVIPNICRA